VRRTQIAAMVGLAALSGCGTVGAHDRVIRQPMVTPTTRELGYEQGYPPQGQCRIHTGTRYGECTAPLNGLRVRFSGGPDPTEFVTLPATTTQTRDRFVRVKAAVANPAINDQVTQTVFGQLLVATHAVIGSSMQATWHYRGGTRRCTGTSGRYGVASCSEMPLGFASRDREPVLITVSFQYRNRLYSSQIVYRAFSD
jgi:hypothetical protein